MSDKHDELGKRRERLSPEKLAQLERRLGGRVSESAEGTPIGRRLETGPAPLSYSQEGLHILERLSPGLFQYNIPLVLRLVGPLNVEALSQSLDEVVARHEALRTCFAAGDGEAWQVIDGPKPGLLQGVDLRDAPESARYDRAVALAREAAREAFDFVHGPMLRAVHFRLGDRDHLLTVIIPHIVFDGWSVGIFLRELASLYNARVKNETAPLDSLPLQFPDYAAWQRSRTGQGVYADDLSFWKERLGGPLPDLAFLRSPSAGSTPSVDGGLVVAHLPDAVVNALRAFCLTSQTTVFATLLAVWKALLYRYTGEDDLVAGTAVAGRDRTELESSIGYFVNTIVLRTSLAGEPTFLETVKRVRATTVEAFEHQQLPFELLVQELRPDRMPGEVPLIQTMFVVQNAPSVHAEFDGLVASRVEVHNGGAKFPLTLMVFEDEGGIRLELEHALAIVDSAMAQRMLAHFERLLADGLTRPETAIPALAMLSSEEENLLLRTWNATEREYPRDKSISQVFEEQAARAPQAVALVFGSQTLTYGSLNARANQVACYLTERGASPGDIVAVCMERTEDLITVILGILKTGCAYLPLDPTYPRKRIEHVLEDAKPVLLVTEGELSRSLAGVCPVLVSTEEAAERCRSLPSDDRRHSAATGESLAYVIYTSGSTGGPKGVCVPHRAVLRLVLNTDYIDIQPEDRVAQASNMAFDASTFEVWGALLNGACLVAVPNDVLLSPRDLKAFVRDERIRVMWITAGLFDRIASEEPDAFTTLDTVLSGGEALTPKWVRRVLEAWAPGRFVNGYGPTEATTFATWHHVREVPEDAAGIPIGKPIANTTAHVLGKHLCLLPIGLPGELCLGGDGLALGYLGDPGLTNERFVRHELGSGPDGRLYRTGDLVRRQPDGTIEFLGRLDSQVKIRGFRIELTEIENTIQGMPGVKNAAVAVHETAGGSKELAAYVVPQEGTEVQPDRIREHLRSRLPEYMAPSRYIRLDEIPLNTNGKVDRRRLPGPGRERGEPGSTIERPVTETEIALAAIWSELLDRPQVSRGDNFFDIGGNSLLAIQLQSRIERRLGFHISVRDLFEHQRLDAQARLLRSERSAARGGTTITRRSMAKPAPLSFSQEGLFVLERLSPGLPEYNVPLVLRLRGELDAEALSQSLDEVAARHEVLRSRFESRDRELVQMADEPRRGLLRVVDLADVPAANRDERALALAVEEAKRPFDFVEGPILRAVLVRLERMEHLLVVVIHHIVFDGWSVGIFLREWSDGYNGSVAGRAVDPASLPFQFSDYAAWQRTRVERGDFADDLAYWREKLAHPPAELRFLCGPSDGARPRSAGGHVTVRMPSQVVGRLRAFRRERQTTLYHTLLAVWKTVLYRYSGEEDLVVGSATAGRDRAELEPLIGYFVNTILLRTRMSPDLSFAGAVERVGAVAMEALEHHRLPFETLVQDLRPNRVPGRVPFIQSMFVVQNAPAADGRFQGVDVERIDLHNGTAKFPVTLMVVEEGDDIRLDLEYETATVDGEVARRILTHFQNLLDDGLAHPEKSIGDLNMLTAEEEHLFLREWNATQRDYPRDATIPALFEAQVAQNSSALAVAYDGEQLTYGELNARANRLARYLAQAGAMPGSIVAVCMERSAGPVAAILAILKAGCAYLPLDPDNPKQRINQILQDAQPVLLLTAGRTSTTLTDAVVSTRPIPTEEDLASFDAEDPMVGSVDGASMAYVMYTSGSTGSPKGVCVPHRAVARLVLNTNYIDIHVTDRIAQASNLAFDASTFEVWGALLNGACLVGIPPEVMLSPGAFNAFLQRERIDVLWVTAGLFNRIASQEPGAFENVGTLVSGDEALTPRWVKRVLETGAPGRFLNGYGPTESTTFATWHHVRTVPENAASIPIGRPVANTTAYVLDNHKRLAPAGIPGELYLGGDGLALGYLGDPDLTDRRFVRHPFATGERLYRTGDLVKRNFDGAIEFLGRLDDRTKIRGFRVELGEIECAIRACAGVKDAAVVVREPAPDVKELVAYLTVQDGENPEIDALRREIAARLPEYMAPTSYIQLEELPLNANGKVDKRRLPMPRRDRTEFGGRYEEPESETERTLAAIWSELLDRSPLSCTDNFFDIGGNSLLAIQLLRTIEDTFGVRLPLRDLFEYPSLAAQARHLDGVRSEPGLPGAPEDAALREGNFLVPVRAKGSLPPLYFAAGAGDVAGTYTALVELLDSEQPFYVAPDPLFTTLDPSDFTVERLAKLYLAEIRARQPEGPYHLGGYSFGAIVAFEIAQQLTRAGALVATLVIVDTSPHMKGSAIAYRRLKQVRARSRYIAEKVALCVRWRHSIYADAALIGRVGLRRLLRLTERSGEEPTVWEYVVWALRDIANQDRMSHGNGRTNGGGTPRLEMLNEPHIRKLNQSMTLAMQAYRQYRFMPYAGRITLIRAEGSPAYGGKDDESLGWAALAAAGVDVRFVPGTHNTLFKSPQVKIVARVLQSCLAAADTAVNGSAGTSRWR